MQSILIAALLTLSSVLAMPSGAPVCPIGGPAPGDAHLLPRANGNITINPRTGPLSDGTFIVTLNGVTLDPSVNTAINASQGYTIAVTSEEGIQQYRGVLVIASSASTNFTSTVLQPVDGTLQASLPCAQIRRAGVTHVSAATKTTSSATLKVPTNVADLKLDVNIVVANNEVQGSVYYYNQYNLTVTGAPPTAPTPGGAPSPNSAPVKPPGKCGLFGLSIFCPYRFFFCRLVFNPKNCCMAQNRCK
jgi:hypothetical protein